MVTCPGRHHRAAKIFLINTRFHVLYSYGGRLASDSEDDVLCDSSVRTEQSVATPIPRDPQNNETYYAAMRSIGRDTKFTVAFFFHSVRLRISHPGLYRPA